MSVQEWLPEAHLARYIASVVENLDLSEIERAYAGRGSEAYHPAMLLGLLIYGYATGTFSSRKPVLSLSKGSNAPPTTPSPSVTLPVTGIPITTP